MAGTLETLLERIRDGRASSEEVAAAQGLVAGDARLPEELRQLALTDPDDHAADAAGLLAVLGADPLFGDALRDAVAEEGGLLDGLAPADEVDEAWLAIARVLRKELGAVGDDIELADAVMMRLPPAWAYGPATAQAVAEEAGDVDVAPAAMEALGAADLGVADAVASECGPVDVVAAVFEALGLDALPPVADAVRGEAGEVDVAAAVVDHLELQVAPVAAAVVAEAGEIDVVSAVFAELGLAELPVAEAVAAEAGEVGALDVPGLAPAVVQPAPAVPAPANRGWAVGALVMAAVALLVFAMAQMPGGTPESVEIAGTRAPAPQMAEIVFAAAGDVIVEDLDYADDVVVMQAEGEEGAVILWMEDA